MGKTRINDEQYQHMAFVWGLNYDRENKVIYGERSGYPFLVYASNASTPLMFTITTSAVSALCPQIGDAEKKLIKSKAPMLTLVGQRDSRITALSANTFDINRAQQNVECILSALISFMLERGFMPCCESCKCSVHTEILQTGFEFRHLCPVCEERIAVPIKQNMLSGKTVSESSIKGIIGTLIGAIIGIVIMAFLASCSDSILTLFMAGLLSGTIPVSIGICMGGRPCTSVKIAVAATVILTVFVGYNISYVVAFAVAREMSVGVAAKTYIVMMLAGMANMRLWILRLVVAYFSAIAGGITSYQSLSNKFANTYKIAHIGGHRG